MKSFCIFTVVFLVAGICSVAAQDLIVLKDGNIIEAKVTEVSSAEIRYKRFDHLDGPTIVLSASNVLSIRYENGKVEKINAAPIAEQKITAIDTNKFIFGINANAGGFLGYLTGGTSGPGINIELGKGNFYTEINLMCPWGGFGGLVTFNGFWPSKIGGFYLGGGIGYGIYQYSSGEEVYYAVPSIPLGLNIGYKFVTKSGLYFRTGTFCGFNFGWLLPKGSSPVFFKPDLAIGWTVR
ncbi:hypothetical protein [Treponema sp. R80B11-R83G3]